MILFFTSCKRTCGIELIKEEHDKGLIRATEGQSNAIRGYSFEQQLKFCKRTRRSGGET